MTSTALQVHEPDAPPEVARANEVDYGGLLALAQALVPTGFLPDHIKTPGQAVAIILTGRELGMPPMRALRSLTMVKGKVTENADSQLARFKADGGHAKFITLDETKAVLWLRHPNGDEHTETFTYNDAERAGLTRPSQSGMPSMYVKHPKPMLRSRAITAGLKSVGWEGGTGTYDPEELGVDVGPAMQNAPTEREDHQGRPANVTRDGEDLNDMTLEQALAVRLRGASNKWGGHGSKPLADVPPSVIKAALNFFREKNAKEPDDALAHQIRALGLVHELRVSEAERDQGKLELDAKQAGAGAPQDPPAGKIERTLVSPASGPARETSANPQAAAEDAASSGSPTAAAGSSAAEKTRALPANRARWSTAQLQARALELLAHPLLAGAKIDSGTREQLHAGKMNHEQLVKQVLMLEQMIDDAKNLADDDDDGLPF